MKFLTALLSTMLIVSGTLSAQTYEGTTVHKKISRSGLNIDGLSEYDFSLSSDVYRVTSELRWVEERVWECEDDASGDGSTGNWHGFFNVPKEQKAQALSSKPRSWRAFAKVINDADDRYETGFSYEVLGKFKKENMSNLGYLVEGKCGYVTKRVFRRIPVRKFHHTEQQDFLVTITNAPLLSGEKESFRIVYDGFESRIVVDTSYNT